MHNIGSCGSDAVLNHEGEVQGALCTPKTASPAIERENFAGNFFDMSDETAVQLDSFGAAKVARCQNP